MSVDPTTGAMRTVLKSAVWELTAGPNGTFAHGREDFLEIRDRNGARLFHRAIPITADDIWLG